MGWTPLIFLLAAWSAKEAHSFLPKGIDISHYQEVVDWQKLKSARVVDFAVAKVTEGNHNQDGYFLRNWEGMKKNRSVPGLLGAYHYLRGAQSAASQVTNILQVLDKCDFNRTKDMVAIDVEEQFNENVTRDQMADTLHEVLEGLKAENFKNIYIYTGPYYWRDKVAWRKYDFSIYNLWIAHYKRITSLYDIHVEGPMVPSTWKDKGKSWKMWQFTDMGEVPGVRGNVDMNFMKD